jgi:hypothetical protein
MHDYSFGKYIILNLQQLTNFITSHIAIVCSVDYVLSIKKFISRKNNEKGVSGN